MAPTEILSNQQYLNAKKIFKSTNIKIELLTSKQKIEGNYSKITWRKIDLIIGTIPCFKKIKFKKLGWLIIDEQHKFGVRQRISLAKKGGKDCDVLLMSATPIPRTMMILIYGDMDISRLVEKPKGRKEILTYVKPEKKLMKLSLF